LNRHSLTRIARRRFKLPLLIVVNLNDVSFFLGLPAGKSFALLMLDDDVEALVVGGFDDFKEVSHIR
jgi:hypothetical protein